ncbi:MAG: hypothetical protein ACJA1C_002826 [Crocinitomicaceae bacterium]|jgi:hypothetical protein
MKSSLITYFFVLLGSSIFAQNTTELKESTKIEKVESDPQNVSKGPYLGAEDKIKAIMKDGQIPASFPKFEDGISREKYKSLVSSWIKTNRELVKEEEYERLASKLK